MMDNFWQCKMKKNVTWNVKNAISFQRASLTPIVDIVVSLLVPVGQPGWNYCSKGHMQPFPIIPFPSSLTHHPFPIIPYSSSLTHHPLPIPSPIIHPSHHKPPASSKRPPASLSLTILKGNGQIVIFVVCSVRIQWHLKIVKCYILMPTILLIPQSFRGLLTLVPQQGVVPEPTRGSSAGLWAQTLGEPLLPLGHSNLKPHPPPPTKNKIVASCLISAPSILKIFLSLYAYSLMSSFTVGLATNIEQKIILTNWPCKVFKKIIIILTNSFLIP